MEILFWISLILLFYTYIGYGLILSFISIFIKKQQALQPLEWPAVTLIVPAYNEGKFIKQKIENSLGLNYPKGKLTILVVTDGCTDNTVNIIRQYDGVTLLTGDIRIGKTAAINKAMMAVKSPLVIFTDANAILHTDSITKLVRHFQQNIVGGVSGEKRVQDKHVSAVGLGERIYWQYESLLKKADAKFYTVIGAAGEIFAIRTALFEPVEEDIILDDFIISARICQKGYRFLYEPEAVATEPSSLTMQQEQERKIRISAGCFQALVLLKGLLNPFTNSRLAFQYLSHRVMRWTICPLLIPVLFITNAALAFNAAANFYSYTFLLQIIFYMMAFAGWLMQGKHRQLKLLLVPYYFVFMNLSLYIGCYRFIANKQSVLWKKAERKAFS